MIMIDLNETASIIVQYSLLGKDKVANMLINNGANVNAQDKKGETPLHWAAKFGNF